MCTYCALPVMLRTTSQATLSALAATGEVTEEAAAAARALAVVCDLFSPHV
jgi:hypothetical protein